MKNDGDWYYFGALGGLASAYAFSATGKRIEPCGGELHESGTDQLDVLSRIYKQHWVPLSRAFDFDKRLLYPLDESEPSQVRKGEEMREVNATRPLHNEEIMIKSSLNSHDSTCHLAEDEGEDFFSARLDVSLTADDDLEGLSCLSEDMNMIRQSNQWTGSGYLMSNDEKSLFSHEVEAHNKIKSSDSSSSMQLISQVKQWNPSVPMVPGGTEANAVGKEEKENISPIELVEINLKSTHIFNSYWIPSAPPLPEDANLVSYSADEEENETCADEELVDINLQSTHKFSSFRIPSAPSLPEDANLVSYSADEEKRETCFCCTGTTVLRSLNAAFSFGKSESERLGPGPQLISGMSVWKRRGEYRTEECSSRACSNSEVKQQNRGNPKIGPVSEYFYKIREKAEELVFCPDKENSTPNSLWKKSLKKIGHTVGNCTLCVNSISLECEASDRCYCKCQLEMSD